MLMDRDDDAQSAILSYVDIHPVATLGTINPDGTPHGAIVYACADTYRPVVYFITKNGTAKYKNLQADSRVSLTITHPAENSTLQANGVAREIVDPVVIDEIMKKLTRLHVNAHEWLPPIAKLRAGAYVLIGIELTWARLAQFEGMTIGDERIFTQLQA
jgi:general stress protein 26